jgi:hypothetical protein
MAAQGRGLGNGDPFLNVPLKEWLGLRDTNVERDYGTLVTKALSSHFKIRVHYRCEQTNIYAGEPRRVPSSQSEYPPGGGPVAEAPPCRCASWCVGAACLTRNAWVDSVS